MECTTNILSIDTVLRLLSMNSKDSTCKNAVEDFLRSIKLYGTLRPWRHNKLRRKHHQSALVIVIVLLLYYFDGTCQKCVNDCLSICILLCCGLNVMQLREIFVCEKCDCFVASLSIATVCRVRDASNMSTVLDSGLCLSLLEINNSVACTAKLTNRVSADCRQ